MQGLSSGQGRCSGAAQGCSSLQEVHAAHSRSQAVQVRVGLEQGTADRAACLYSLRMLATKLMVGCASRVLSVCTLAGWKCVSSCRIGYAVRVLAAVDTAASPCVDHMSCVSWPLCAMAVGLGSSWFVQWVSAACLVMAMRSVSVSSCIPAVGCFE